MSLSGLSVRRPVLAAVANILIVVVGAASLVGLPVRELPDVDAVQITVTTPYVGAAPEIIDTEITEPIESAISGVDGVRRIESTSREGRSRVVVEFETDRGIDLAANDVREAVSRILEDLPEEAEQPEIAKSDDQADPVVRLSLTSDRLSPADLTDFAERRLVDRLSTVQGVSLVQIYGERRYAMRIWLDRRALAGRGLTVAEVEAALRAGNVELPAGTLESETRQFTLRTDSRLRDPEEFRNLVVATRGGYPIRLDEVADVEVGVEDDSVIARADGRNAVSLGVIRQSRANTIAVSEGVRAVVEGIRPELPAGVSLDVTSDDATFINASIFEVMKTLAEAVVLVVVVIYLFLASFRAVLIPAVTIPVSVIGSFAVMAALGFSVNVLTLLALILAIGLVVDDAIVVLENVQRRIEEGEAPLAAAYLGTRQVLFAVVATSVTLIAVFVPIAYIQGEVGRLFREFALVLAGAIAISTFVALTLAPMLGSKVLRRVERRGLLGRWVEAGLDRTTAGYRRALAVALDAPLVVGALAVGLSVVSFGAYQALPQELTPQEDRGTILVRATGPQGSTVEATDAAMRQVTRVLSRVVEAGEAQGALSISGIRAEPNGAIGILRLDDWGERDRTQQEIIADLRPEISRIPGLRAFLISPSGLTQGGGGRQELEFVVSGPDYESVQRWSEEILRRARANPNLTDVDTDFERTRPQVDIRIDRRKAEDLGVDVTEISSTLQAFFASRNVTQYLDRGREYEVVLQARAEDRRTLADLDGIFVRTGAGELVPLSGLVTLATSAAAPDLRRFDRLPSITVSASPVQGYDLGAAVEFFRQAAAEALPPEARTGFTGTAEDLEEASGSILLTFGLAVLVVFLVLAAQFESWIHPAVILLTVPLALAGAFLALLLTGGSINIYSQIGGVLLVGLVAKNGILIVDFANQLRDEGRPVREAILEGSVLRLRPILMTVAATILGAVPLVIATGAGAESRIAIGTVVIGGLSVATLFTLFLVPVLYDRLARFTKPAGAVSERLDGLLGDGERRAS